MWALPGLIRLALGSHTSKGILPPLLHTCCFSLPADGSVQPADGAV